MEVRLPLTRRQTPVAAFILAAVVSAVVVFPSSFLLRGNFLLGLAIFPWLILPRGTPRFNYALFVLVVFFTVAVWIYQVRMFYFFTVVFAILLAVELTLGRVDKLAYLLILVMSPFFSQLTGILGFNFRMKLSQFAGDLMQRAGLDVEVEGNTMMLQGTSFIVDDACAGLNMLAIAFLAGIFMISYCARTTGRTISSVRLLLYFVVVVTLNLISNLFRIILLVFFKILPENPMHGTLGLIVFFVYVALPLYWLTPWWTHQFGVVCPHPSEKRFSSGALQNVWMVLLLGVIIPTGIFLCSERKPKDEVAIADVGSVDLVVSHVKDGVTRFSGDNVLIYVKSIPEFFSGEHTPLFCWRGSGYMFSKIHQSEIDGRQIYIGELTKGNEVLHTAWWYSNGESETISQFEWRWRMFAKNDRFCLINVTSATEHALMENVNCILSKRYLNIVSNK